MYTVIHSKVDGAGLVGEYIDLEEAIAVAEKEQAKVDQPHPQDGRRNPWRFRFHVYNRRGEKVYSTQSRKKRGIAS